MIIFIQKKVLLTRLLCSSYERARDVLCTARIVYSIICYNFDKFDRMEKYSNKAIRSPVGVLI